MSWLYEHGGRGPICNGCKYARLKHELGDRFHVKYKAGWTDVYELDASPTPGQGEPQEIDGHPVRFRAGFMSIGHSDECYHWKPPKTEVNDGKNTRTFCYSTNRSWNKTRMGSRN